MTLYGAFEIMACTAFGLAYAFAAYSINRRIDAKEKLRSVRVFGPDERATVEWMREPERRSEDAGEAARRRM